MRLSVVIVAYNSAHCIRPCLETVREVLGDAETIVVDNMSTDGTAKVVGDSSADTKLISVGQNVGYGSACNIGVRQAEHDHVLLMNPDVVIRDADCAELETTFSDYRYGLRAPALRDEGATIARPQIFASRSWPAELLTLILTPFRPRGLPQRDTAVRGKEADWASGALLLARRSEFLDVGGFAERFFLYYEDQELGTRYRKRGLPIRATGAIAGMHDRGRSSRKEDERRTIPTAWSLLSWLEFVALTHGPRRGTAAWQAIRCAYGAGAKLMAAGGIAPGGNRFRRKALELRSVHTTIRALAREGVAGKHSFCPLACQIVA